MTISSKIVAALEDAQERNLFQGEDIDYDVSMIAVPGSNGQPQPMVGLSFTIGALDLSQGHAVMFLLPPICPPQEEVDEIVRRVVQGLVNQRMQAAQEATAPASSNGHKDIPDHVSKSGLILPGHGH